MSLIMSVLPSQHTGGPFTKPLKSGVNRMHSGEGKPVSAGDEGFCEGGSCEAWRTSEESSISVKCGHYFFPSGECRLLHVE